MFAVMLIFAFTMSLIIGYGEKMVRQHEEEQVTSKSDADEVFVAEKLSDKAE